jgi:hypothetical protein
LTSGSLRTEGWLSFSGGVAHFSRTSGSIRSEYSIEGIPAIFWNPICSKTLAISGTIELLKSGLILTKKIYVSPLMSRAGMFCLRIFQSYKL